MVLLQRRFLRQPPWVANELWRRARAVPSLDLRFAETKSLNDVVSGQNLITFTRASSGTYVGSDGLIKTAAVDEPRFDHNPTTGESLGLLVEESRTNLLVRSEEFGTTWTNNNLTITNNAITAPDGTLTAEKFVPNTVNGDHRVFQTAAASTLGEVRTASAFFKAAEWNRCAIFVTTDAFANFTLTGSGTASQTSGISASIVPFGNGWYRCSVTYTSSVASSVVQLRVINPSGAFQYAGDDTSGIYVWGAQLEVGSFPTSHIPTTSATVTRSADVASITGANFTRWYRQDEGTMFARSGVNRVFDATRVTLEFGDGTNNNRFFLGNNGLTSQAYFFAASSGVSQVVSTSPNAFSSGFANNAITYKTDDFALVSNGATPVLDTSGTVPTVSALYIGKLGSTSGISTMWCGTISRLTYWQSRLPNSILQNLTR